MSEINNQVQVRQVVNRALTNPSIIDRMIGQYYSSVGDGYAISIGASLEVQSRDSSDVDDGILFYKEEKFRIRGTEDKIDELNSSPTGDITYHLMNPLKSQNSISYNYNYEFKDYEQLSRQTNINLLPSYLLFDYAKTNVAPDGFDRAVKTYDEVFTLDTELYSSQVSYDFNSEQLGVVNDFEKFDDKDQLKGPEIKNYDVNYFRFFTKQMIENTPIFNSFVNKNKNIFLMYNNEMNNLSMLPYYVTLKGVAPRDPPNPSVQSATNRLESLRDLLIEEKSMFDVFSFIKNSPPNVSQFLIDGELKSLNVWDFFDWWSSIASSNISDDKEDEIFLGNKEDINQGGLQNYISNRIKKLILLGKSRSVFKSLIPTFEEIVIDKDPCKNILLGYKITKHRSPDLPPVQSFFIIKENYEFVDNQLQFDKQYFYRVSEIRLVVGSIMEYEFEKQDERSGALTTRTRPSVKFIEILDRVHTARAVVAPIYSPHVYVANERNTKNLVKFLLSDKLGHSVEHKEPYIPILPNDNFYMDKIRQAGFSDENDRSRFYSRARTGNFDVFKIDFKPTSYTDFSEGFLGTVGSNEEYVIDQERQTVFVDYIENERTYYYLFRSVDHYGQGGNPSYIYETYLITDSDESILRYKAYPLYEKDQMFDVQTSFRKFLQIQPNNSQVLFSEDYDILQVQDSDNKDFLGIVNDTEKIWEFNSQQKYFKLRFTNKQTGKKFDLNIRYKLEKE